MHASRSHLTCESNIPDLNEIAFVTRRYPPINFLSLYEAGRFKFAEDSAAQLVPKQVGRCPAEVRLRNGRAQHERIDKAADIAASGGYT
jgi:hypothetical protein